jgi:hypothetical protein
MNRNGGRKIEKPTYSQPTKNPMTGDSPFAANVYSPPAVGMYLPIWPIEIAANTQAIRATSADSGSAVPARPTPMPMENAVAAAGAM